MRPEEAEARLLALELFGMRFGLDRMGAMMEVMGHPERSFRSVHVVGTNGKSSTARMTALILGRHGLGVGTYLSPHLVSYTERIRVNDADIAPGRFAGAIERAFASAEIVNRGRDPDDQVTQFELLTAAAYSELAEQGVQTAVIEAGLGGRYDATNVIPSQVTVLTNVGLEHTRWLGPTVEAIAREKLDVLRPGSVLVLGPDLHLEAAAVARELGAARGARLVWVDGESGDEVAALGRFQRRNFAVARAAAEAFLAALDRPLDEAAVRTAAADIRVPGRLQEVATRPRTILDGAHNPDGVAALAESLEDLSGLPAGGTEPPVGATATAQRVAVMSILDDKDAAGMLAALVPHFDAFVLTLSHNPRALPPPTLRSLLVQVGGPAGEVVADPHRALERARELAGPEGFVLATGSIYLIGDLLAPSTRSDGRRRSGL